MYYRKQLLTMKGQKDDAFLHHLFCAIESKLNNIDYL